MGNNAGWTNSGGSLTTAPSTLQARYNSGTTVAPTAAAMRETGSTPVIIGGWYSLPAPGAYDTNSWIAGQIFPAGSEIRVVVPPVHVTLNIANPLWANDANDWCTAANGYTGSDTATFEIMNPSGAVSQFVSTITVS